VVSQDDVASGEVRVAGGDENGVAGGGCDDSALIEILKDRYVTIYLAFNEVRRWNGQDDIAAVVASSTQVRDYGAWCRVQGLVFRV
jgi:hypothetical protein